MHYSYKKKDKFYLTTLKHDKNLHCIKANFAVLYKKIVSTYILALL